MAFQSLKQLPKFIAVSVNRTEAVGFELQGFDVLFHRRAIYLIDMAKCLFAYYGQGRQAKLYSIRLIVKYIPRFVCFAPSYAHKRTHPCIEFGCKRKTDKDDIFIIMIAKFVGNFIIHGLEVLRPKREIDKFT